MKHHHFILQTNMAAHVDMRNDTVVVAEEKSMALEDPSGDKLAITGDNAVHGKFTVWLALTAVVCFLGSSFQFGYNLGVINAPKDVSMLGQVLKPLVNHCCLSKDRHAYEINF